VQAQHVEAPVERQPRRLAAETLAAALAERDAEVRAALQVGDLEQAAGADRRAIDQVVDRERDRLGFALRGGLVALLDPLLLRLRRRDREVLDAEAHLGLVHPAPVGLGEIGTERAERDALAGDEQVGILGAHAAVSSGVSLRRQPVRPIRESTSAASSR
jgi:hypothetical protein